MSHVKKMLSMTIPFRIYLCQRSTGRMKNNHFWNVAENTISSAGTLSPFDVLCKLYPCKWSNLGKIGAAHNQVSRSAKTVSLDIQLESISEDSLVCFYSRKPMVVFAPNPNITAKNDPLGSGRNNVESVSKPVGMRATVGIYERKYVTESALNSEIACWTRSGLRLNQQTGARTIGGELLGKGSRAIVNDNDLKKRPRAGFEHRGFQDKLQVPPNWLR